MAWNLVRLESRQLLCGVEVERTREASADFTAGFSVERNEERRNWWCSPLLLPSRHFVPPRFLALPVWPDTRARARQVRLVLVKVRFFYYPGFQSDPSWKIKEKKKIRNLCHMMSQLIRREFSGDNKKSEMNKTTVQWFSIHHQKEKKRKVRIFSSVP